MTFGASAGGGGGGGGGGGAINSVAIIDKDGRVGELQVISGHPLLVQSALDAVKNWRYQPTQLNGEAVEVDTTITVTFVLGG